MLYSGYFRNTDTSVDPKGQLYKVEIFTEGKLYTYRNLSYIPLEESITLSDNPFVVDYSGDDNKYKSYKGSTASVGIIMENYGFIAKGKCDIFVRLLRWKNEVVEATNYLYNTETSATLLKKQIMWWRGYDTAEMDNFAYDVVWCGYATPNVFQQNFTKVTEEYTLECQDVLTTLQYFEYTSTKKGTTTFKDTIMESLKQLPVNPIKSVYVTNTKRHQNNYVANSSVTTGILTMLSTINDNWINESYEKTNCLDVIDNIMSYLGLTILQDGDNLYVTTPDAIGQGLKYYYKYDVPQDLEIFVRREGPYTYTPTRRADYYLCGKDIEISDGELGNADTRISTTNTYKKAIITTDEYYDENLVLDINNDDNLEERFRWDDNLNFMKLDPDDPVDRNIWSHDYPYNYNMVNKQGEFSGSCYDIAENDVDDTNYASITQYYYPRDTKTETDEGWYAVQNYSQTSKPQSRSDIFYKVGCSIVDYSVKEYGNNAMTQYMEDYNGTRAYLFHNTAEQVEAGSAWELNIAPLMLDPSHLQAPANAQHVITWKTKKVYMRSNQSINIRGNLEFFQTITMPIPAGWNVDQLKAYKNYMFVWCKLKVHSDRNNQNYYVTNNDAMGSYRWQTGECWFKLWYDNYVGYDQDADRNDRGTTTVYAFENMFQFTKNTRGVDGTCISLPTDFSAGEYQQIEFSMRRPWGCGREEKITSIEHFYPAQYCVMTNFSIKVIDNSETTFRYQAEENNQFKADVNDLGVDDFTTSLMVSSDYYKNTSKATVIGLPGDMCIDDTATGSALFPEANYILNVEKSYATSKLLLDIALPYEVRPLDRLTWTQIPDKIFAIDKMSVDYANHLYSLTLIETNLDEVTADIYSEKRTKNFRRNGDNLYNPLPRRNKKKVEEPQEHSPIQPTLTLETTGIVKAMGYSVFNKHVWIEPTNNSRELVATLASYVAPDNEGNQQTEIEINQNGELTIKYTFEL